MELAARLNIGIYPCLIIVIQWNVEMKQIISTAQKFIIVIKMWNVTKIHIICKKDAYLVSELHFPIADGSYDQFSYLFFLQIYFLTS